MTGLWFALRAFLRLGFGEAMSYPLAVVDRLINVAALVALVYFGGHLVAQGAEIDGPYFAFGMTGLALVGLFEASLTSFKYKVRHYQLTGALEACAMTRTPFWQILLATPAYDIVRAALQAGVLITAGHLVVGVAPSPAGVLLAAGVVALGCVAFVELGVIAASAVLVLKHGEPVTRALSLSGTLFSGAFFPRSVLPAGLAQLGSWLPIAPALDASRALLAGAPAAEVAPPVLHLAITAALLLPVTIAVFRASVRRVLRDGTIGHY